MNKIKSLFLVISLLIICSISYSKENVFIIYNIDEKIIKALRGKINIASQIMGDTLDAWI